MAGKTRRVLLANQVTFLEMHGSSHDSPKRGFAVNSNRFVRLELLT